MNAWGNRWKVLAGERCPELASQDCFSSVTSLGLLLMLVSYNFSSLCFVVSFLNCSEIKAYKKIIPIKAMCVHLGERSVQTLPLQLGEPCAQTPGWRPEGPEQPRRWHHLRVCSEGFLVFYFCLNDVPIHKSIEILLSTWCHPYGRKWRGLKSLLMSVKEVSEKGGLKCNIQKTKTLASGPITSWWTDGEKVEAVTDFIFLGSKITADDDCSHGIKIFLLLGRKAMTNLDNVLKSEMSFCQQRPI